MAQNTGGSVLATDLRIAYRFAYAPGRPKKHRIGDQFQIVPLFAPRFEGRARQEWLITMHEKAKDASVILD
jgi:hypothetical protein